MINVININYKLINKQKSQKSLEILKFFTVSDLKEGKIVKEMKNKYKLVKNQEFSTSETLYN